MTCLNNFNKDSLTSIHKCDQNTHQARHFITKNKGSMADNPRNGNNVFFKVFCIVTYLFIIQHAVHADII